MYSLVLMMAFSTGADPVAPVVASVGCTGVVYSGGCTGNGFFHKHQETGNCGGGGHGSFFSKLWHKDHGCTGGYAVSSPVVVPAPAGPLKPLPAGEPIPAPKEKKQANAGDAARIVVQLPAEAKLFVDDAPTQSATGRRTLLTPALLPGLTYSYTLRIEVSRDGKARSEFKRVDVTAGETVEVSFAESVEQVNLEETSRPAE